MRVRAFKQGEVTAFLALVFALLVSFAGSMMESASLQSAKSYRRADVNRAIESVFAEYQKELLEEYDIFSLEGSYESGNFDEGKLVDRLSYYGASGMEQEITGISFLTDHRGQAFLEQAARYAEYKYGLNELESLAGDIHSWERQEELADQYDQQEESLGKEFQDLLEANEAQLPQENNPLPNVEQLKVTALTELVLPSDRPVSAKAIELGNVVSGRSLNHGYGDFSDVAGTKKISGFAVGEYFLDHFSSAVPGDSKNIQTGVLEYELEYLLSGRATDKENLESVLRKLLLLRFVPNYGYLQQDAGKRAEAQALALTLCTVMVFPAAAEALAQLLLLAWAFGESIMDLRSLMQGYRVPLVKNTENWQLSLSGLMTIGTEEDRQEGMSGAEGFCYRDYLRVLLLLHKKEELAFRGLDIIELNLRQKDNASWFHADYCIYQLRIRSKVRLRRGISYEFVTYFGYR